MVSFNFNEFTSQPLPPRLHVTYNYLHDSESLCWVHLWILLSRIPYSPSQTLEDYIFRNVRVASSTRRNLFLDGIGEKELDQVHPTVRDLVKLWNLPRHGLVRAFRSTLPDKRTDAIYADVYFSLYALYKWSSETVLALDLSSVRPLDHLTVPPSTPRNHSRGPSDDEDYVPSEAESEWKRRDSRRGANQKIQDPLSLSFYQRRRSGVALVRWDSCLFHCHLQITSTALSKIQGASEKNKLRVLCSHCGLNLSNVNPARAAPSGYPSNSLLVSDHHF